MSLHLSWNINPGLAPLGESDEMIYKQVTSRLSPAEMPNLKFLLFASASCGSQLCELIPNYDDLQENLSPECEGAYGRIQAQASQAVSWVTSFWPVQFYYPAAGGEWLLTQ